MSKKGAREGLKGIVCKGWNKREQPWQREVRSRVSASH